MKIESVTIENFRSIKEARKINFSDLTVLVGKNNEGKSNILRAIRIATLHIEYSSIMPSTNRARSLIGRIGPRDGYDWDRDFPESQKNAENLRTTKIILEFRLNDKELHAFREEIKSKIDGLLPIQVEFGQDSSHITTIRKPGKGNKTLNSKIRKICRFVNNYINFDYIGAQRTAKITNEEIEKILERLLSDLDQSSVMKDAVEKISEMQQPILNELSNQIKDTLRVFLPNIKNASIQIDNYERMRALARNVKVVIDDGEPTPIGSKGDGVQSLAALALVRAPLQRNRGLFGRVLAIEEPESHLHPQAIRELKKVLEDVSTDAQVIISTHSPIFANRNNIPSNIIVDNKKAFPAASLSDIRDCLGVEAPDNLIGAELSLICEGKCDQIFLEKYIELHYDDLQVSLYDGRFVITPAGGVDKISYLLKQNQSIILNSCAVLDNDPAGRDAYKKISTTGILGPSNLFLCSVDGRRDTEIEDFLPNELLERTLQECGVEADEAFLGSRARFSNRFEKLCIRRGRLFDEDFLESVKVRLSERLSSWEGDDLEIENVPSLDDCLKKCREVLRFA